MKKVIRLTESDLIRIVKRVISEQSAEPDTEYLNELESEVKKLRDEVLSIRKENFQNKKEALKEKFIEIYENMIDFFDKVIQKLKTKASNVKDDVKKKRLENKIERIEKEKQKLIKKKEELRTTGNILTKNEKINILMSLSWLASMIFTGAASGIVKSIANIISGGKLGTS